MPHHPQMQKPKQSRPVVPFQRQSQIQQTDPLQLSQQSDTPHFSQQAILSLQRTIGNRATLQLMSKKTSIIQTKRYVYMDNELVDPDNPDQVYQGKDAPDDLQEGDVWDDETKVVSHVGDRMEAIFSGKSSFAPSVNLPSQEEMQKKLSGLTTPTSKTSETPKQNKVEKTGSTMEWLKSLGITDAENAAIQKYTTSFYKDINKYLRNNKDTESTQKICQAMKEHNNPDGVFIDLVSKAFEKEDEVGSGDMLVIPPTVQPYWLKAFERFIELIVSGMEKLPLPSERTVSRGANLDTQPEFLKKHTHDKIITDAGFMSTAVGTPFAKDSMIIIELPEKHPGRDIQNLSTYAPETEMLFPPGTGYEVVEIITSDQKEFPKLLEQFVPDRDDRETRFNKVKRIIRTKLTLPKK